MNPLPSPISASSVFGDASSSEGCELWSTGALGMLWLPCTDAWNNPFLAEEPGDTGRIGGKSNALVWLYRVDVTFGAWVTRAVQRARAQNVALNIDANYSFLKGFLRDRWPEVERLAASKVWLPGAELRAYSAYLASRGLGPVWAGFEKHLTPDEAPAASPAARQSLPITSSERKRRVAKKTVVDAAQLF